MGTGEALAATSVSASARISASMAPHVGAHNGSIDAIRQSSRVDPRTLRTSRVEWSPKSARINSVDRRPIPVEWNSRRRQTAAAFSLARRHCFFLAVSVILQSVTAAQSTLIQNECKHSLTNLRASTVTRCVPYAPQPLSNSKEPNNAAPRAATRLKLQLTEGSWSFFQGCKGVVMQN